MINNACDWIQSGRFNVFREGGTEIFNKKQNMFLENRPLLLVT